MAISKRIKLDSNVLLEWIYDENNIKNEDYLVISNINEQSRSYVSTKPLNSIDNNLITIDSVLKRYTKVDLNKFNFLQKQDYAGNNIPFDKIKIYFPIDFNFSLYVGFNLRVYSLDYENKKIYNISNYFYDKSLDSNIGVVELISPFNFNEKYWGKCITLEIPSIYNVSRDRFISNTANYAVPNTINSNLTNGVGLSQTSPIFIDFSFISASEMILGSKYYTLGDTYETSVPQQPEYQSLGVQIVESDQGDFFEVYGIYQGTNEMLDDFVDELESTGKKIEIQYNITLYEEGLQSGNPLTLLVTENFAQKIPYRPIIKYSNTTASIDVVMIIRDIVHNSEIERYASIGLTKNIFKYGKSLTRINVDSSITKPKIYKAAPDNIVISGTANVTEVKTNITKVAYPVLYDKYKILVNSTNAINSDYKSNGLLNIIITPFDTVIKFTIAKSLSENNEPTPYDLTDISNNATLKLTFKSQNKSLDKDYYAQSSDNNLSVGVIVYKITENDISIIKEMYDKGFKNFYLTLVSSNSKTLLYSGRYEFYENVKFVDIQTQNQNDIIDPYLQQIDRLNETIKQLNVDKSVLQNSQFNKINIPYDIPENLIKDNKKFFNFLIFLRRTYSTDMFESILEGFGIKDWIYNDYVYYIGGLSILTIQQIEKLSDAVSKTIRIDIYDGQNSESKTFDTDVVVQTPVEDINKKRDGKFKTLMEKIKQKQKEEQERLKKCLLPESLINLPDGSSKMIKDLKIGDEVKTVSIDNLPPYVSLTDWKVENISSMVSKAPIREVIVHETKDGFYDINDGLMKVTGEHVVLVFKNNEYTFTNVDTLVVGDMFIDINNKLVEITNIIHKPYVGLVYNLTLNNDYVYFVNDVLVHNAKSLSQLLKYIKERKKEGFQ